jgi:hypothetical protein
MPEEVAEDVISISLHIAEKEHQIPKELLFRLVEICRLKTPGIIGHIESCSDDQKIIYTYQSVKDGPIYILRFGDDQVDFDEEEMKNIIDRVEAGLSEDKNEFFIHCKRVPYCCQRCDGFKLSYYRRVSFNCRTCGEHTPADYMPNIKNLPKRWVGEETFKRRYVP